MNIKEFWVGLCQSYINFNDSQDNHIYHDKITLIINKITYIDLVNSVHVFNIIYEFLVIFGYILMTNNSLYANELLNTNIKRLDKLINITNIKYILPNYFTKFYSYFKAHTSLLKKTYKFPNLLNNNFRYIFNNIENLIKKDDYSLILDYLINTNNIHIIDYFNTDVSFYKHINNKFDTDLKNNIKGSKLQKILNGYKKTQSNTRCTTNV